MQVSLELKLIYQLLFFESDWDQNDFTMHTLPYIKVPLENLCAGYGITNVKFKFLQF